MKKIFVCFLFTSVGFLSFSQAVKDNKMPVTTSSKQALTFYNGALKKPELPGSFTKVQKGRNWRLSHYNTKVTL